MIATAHPDASPRARVLVTDDEEQVQRLIAAVLQREGYAVTLAADGPLGLRALGRELFDVVLLDLHLPGMGGLEVLSAGRTVQTDAQFVLMTGDAGVDSAVEAMKRGAFDYISKPIGRDRLLLVVERALGEAQLRREVALLRQQAAQGGRTRMIGGSPALRRVHELVDRVAPTRAAVLITGEAGTGKETVARAIHERSSRARGPFLSIHCSTLPESLLESELFGHVKGSLTGAPGNKRGLFEEASAGTLFLDEISTISPAIQARLLRVLKERRIQRVGSSQDIPVDVRLIAAGHRELARAVEEGRFREDLYHRLNVFPIAVPPLRERRGDIPLLANHFRLRFAAEHGIDPPEIPADTMRRLVEHEWPGNVRELESLVERSVILHAGARTIPFETPRPAGAGGERDLVARAARERWSLERLEREYTLEVLRETRGHRIRTSEILGVDRRTLYRKLKQYECDGQEDEIGLSVAG